MARVVVLLVLALAASAFAGCASPVDDVEASSVHERIQGAAWSLGSGRGCLPTSTDSWWNCMDFEIGFTELRCDPPQLFPLWLTAEKNSDGLMPALVQIERKDRGVDAPEEAFVYCEYAFTWTLGAHSDFPDAVLETRLLSEGEESTDSCHMSLSSCGIGGEYRSSFRLDGPDEEITLTANLTARVVAMPGLLDLEEATFETAPEFTLWT